MQMKIKTTKLINILWSDAYRQLGYSAERFDWPYNTIFSHPPPVQCEPPKKPWTQSISELYDSGFEGGSSGPSFDLPLLRDPVHLLSSESGSSSDSENNCGESLLGFSWIYSTKRLIQSSVQYPVFYLGASKEMGDIAYGRYNLPEQT